MIGLYTSLAIRIGWNVNKRSYQLKKGLLLRLPSSLVQEVSKLDVFELPAGGAIRLMDHERLAGLRLSSKIPSVSAGASIQFASF